MFTGLIEATGTVSAVDKRAGTTRIEIAAPELASRLKTGDSIAVSGVCLTALDIAHGVFHADLAAETVQRTSLASLARGSKVNLEMPTPAGTPLGGHVVQGHVDGTGTLLSLTQVDTGAERELADWWLRLSVPGNLRRYMVEKGSIALEGISLTIARVEDDVLSIAIIPHTYAATNLHSLKPGHLVNIEADVLMKFAEKRQADEKHDFELTLEYLVAHGY